MTYLFDFEVFAHDWVLVAKELDCENFIVYHNDPEGVGEFLSEITPLLGGFNNKHYDQFIIYNNNRKQNLLFQIQTRTQNW